ncbi:MAG: type II secretion system major pseudopilin GspG [Thermodesulfobacteriota bacterium]|nr:type II secretion system major pseudopilin GspG [Thermodesulfobacteriota bacterium]
MLTKKTKDRGFTLIEIMIVIVILGILAWQIAPRIMGKPEEARRVKAQMDMESLETALKLYKLDNGYYPSTEQGLEALIRLPEVGKLPMAWREGGYLEKGRIPKDPWKNDYIYLSPGLHGDFDLMSYGPDGQPGGEGENEDISNWELE